jgi:hypothetical protein
MITIPITVHFVIITPMQTMNRFHMKAVLNNMEKATTVVAHVKTEHVAMIHRNF